MDHHHHKNPLHILVVAPPFQGHINPLIQLTLNLASHGFTITFVNTHWAHHQIMEARKRLRLEEADFDHMFTRARESGLDIRYRTVSDGFPLSFDRSRNLEQYAQGRVHVYPAHIDELVGELISSDRPPPTCLVADTFSSWGSDIASKYGLVYVSFWTQPALVLTLYYHVELLKKNGHYGCHIGNRKDTIDYIPGVAALEPKNLMSFLQETDTSKVIHRVIQKAFTDVKKADFIICNTMEELEPEPISALKELHPVYAIGPLFPDSITNQAMEMNLWSESDCIRWLDSKPEGSVLYASFGSYAHFNNEDIKIISEGLILSGVNFICVLRPNISADVAYFLPERFQENVGDRGLVVPWCNQNAIITHSAAGGFLTHCGWNSILESIWSGLPMICFPLLGDQTTNRKLVVDDWRVGINLSEGKLVSSEEVAERIRLLMSGERSQELRKNVEEIRKIMESGLSRNGSSKMNLDKFVEKVKAKMEDNQV